MLEVALASHTVLLVATTIEFSNVALCCLQRYIAEDVDLE